MKAEMQILHFYLLLQLCSIVCNNVMHLSMTPLKKIVILFYLKLLKCAILLSNRYNEKMMLESFNASLGSSHFSG